MDVRLPMVPARPPYPWFARAVLGFDTWLRRRNVSRLCERTRRIGCSELVGK